MRTTFVFILFFMAVMGTKAQYAFSGYVDNDRWHENVYLSVIEDYRKLFGVYSEQIIAKIKTDSLGRFVFRGNQLDTKNKIYRIHVDSCPDNEQEANHFNGHCEDSKEVLFIASNKDTISFPFSFGSQMFCSIESTNQKSNLFVKIDSLREEMRFDFAQYRSEASRKLNNKKWFTTLHEFGKQLNEPLGELYIYAFLSDRSNRLHDYYIEDLKTNAYYDDLLTRLTAQYPNSLYTRQYKAELNSDKFIISEDDTSTRFNWTALLYIALAISLLINFWFLLKQKKQPNNRTEDPKAQLTKQEQNILNLLLDNKSNKEIADTLFVSLSTVKTHVNNIYRKLNVQSRSEIKNLFSK